MDKIIVKGNCFIAVFLCFLLGTSAWASRETVKRGFSDVGIPDNQFSKRSRPEQHDDDRSSKPPRTELDIQSQMAELTKLEKNVDGIVLGGAALGDPQFLTIIGSHFHYVSRLMSKLNEIQDRIAAYKKANGDNNSSFYEAIDQKHLDVSLKLNKKLDEINKKTSEALLYLQNQEKEGAQNSVAAAALSSPSHPLGQMPPAAAAGCSPCQNEGQRSKEYQALLKALITSANREVVRLSDAARRSSAPGNAILAEQLKNPEIKKLIDLLSQVPDDDASSKNKYVRENLMNYLYSVIITLSPHRDKDGEDQRLARLKSHIPLLDREQTIFFEKALKKYQVQCNLIAQFNQKKIGEVQKKVNPQSPFFRQGP